MKVDCAGGCAGVCAAARLADSDEALKGCISDSPMPEGMRGWREISCAPVAIEGKCAVGGPVVVTNATGEFAGSVNAALRSAETAASVATI
jgi:hypothetical protein